MQNLIVKCINFYGRHPNSYQFLNGHQSEFDRQFVWREEMLKDQIGKISKKLKAISIDFKITISIKVIICV